MAYPDWVKPIYNDGSKSPGTGKNIGTLRGLADDKLNGFYECSSYTDGDCLNALQYAAYCNNPDALKYLLREKRWSVDRTTYTSSEGTEVQGAEKTAFQLALAKNNHFALSEMVNFYNDNWIEGQVFDIGTVLLAERAPVAEDLDKACIAYLAKNGALDPVQQLIDTLLENGRDIEPLLKTWVDHLQGDAAPAVPAVPAIPGEDEDEYVDEVVEGESIYIQTYNMLEAQLNALPADKLQKRAALMRAKLYLLSKIEDPIDIAKIIQYGDFDAFLIFNERPEAMSDNAISKDFNSVGAMTSSFILLGEEDDAEEVEAEEVEAEVREVKQSHLVSMVDFQDNSTGNNLVHFAASSDKDCRLMIQLLDEMGHNIFQKNNKSDTPLDIAIRQGHRHVVYYLSEKIKLNEPHDVDASMPIHRAVSSEQWDPRIVRTLVEHGADINAVDRAGNTVLHLAVIEQNIAKVKLLVELGADKSIKNSNGQIALELLVDEHEQITALLRGTYYYEAVLRAIHERDYTNVAYFSQLAPIGGIDGRISPLKYAIGANDHRAAQILSRYGHNVEGIYQVPEEVEEKQEPYNAVTFKGGSVKGVAYLGAIEELMRLGLLDPEKAKFAGTSAGAITALLMGLGYDLEDFREIFLGNPDGDNAKKLDFEAFVDDEGDWVKFVKNILKKEGGPGVWDGLKALYNAPDLIKYLEEHQYGLCSGKKFFTWITQTAIWDKIKDTDIVDVIWDKIKDQIEGEDKSVVAEYVTFRDLYNYEAPDGTKPFREMSFVCTVLPSSEILVCNAEKTPDVCIADAVRGSMAIPIFFQAHQLNERYEEDGVYQLRDHEIRPGQKSLCVDGGVLANFTPRIFDHEAAFAENVFSKNDRSLALCLVDGKTYESYDQGTEPVYDKLEGIGTYLFKLLFASESNAERNDVLGPERHRTAFISTFDVDTLEFDLSDERKIKLIEKGREGIRAFAGRRKTLHGATFSNHTLRLLASKGAVIQESSGNYLTLHLSPVKRLSAEDVFRIFMRAQEQELPLLRSLANTRDPLTGNTPLHYVIALLKSGGLSAVERENVERCKVRLLYCNANEYARNIHGDRPEDVVLGDRFEEESIVFAYKSKAYLKEQVAQLEEISRLGEIALEEQGNERLAAQQEAVDLRDEIEQMQKEAARSREAHQQALVALESRTDQEILRAQEEVNNLREELEQMQAADVVPQAEHERALAELEEQKNQNILVVQQIARQLQAAIDQIKEEHQQELRALSDEKDEEMMIERGIVKQEREAEREAYEARIRELEVQLQQGPAVVPADGINYDQAEENLRAAITAANTTYDAFWDLNKHHVNEVKLYRSRWNKLHGRALAEDIACTLEHCGYDLTRDRDYLSLLMNELNDHLVLDAAECLKKPNRYRAGFLDAYNKGLGLVEPQVEEPAIPGM